MAGRTRAGVVAAAAIAAALTIGSSSAALADTPSPSPTPSTSATTSPQQAAAQALAARIVALQRTAEQQGEVADKAGERANAAQVASDEAAQALADAQAAAITAEQQAVATRARAAAVAAQLARTNLGTLPLDLMLNGRSAEGILGGLSTTSQLSIQSKLLFDQAQSDEVEAERLQAVADTAASDAATKAAAAAKTYAAAKQEAAAAKAAVDTALAEQAKLLAGSGADPAVCAAVGATPVAACLPTAGAPKGDSVGAKVVRFAIAQIGKPYVFAAAGPDAYDCSGLTLAAYASVGIAIGTHSATNQYDTAEAEGDLVPLAEAKPGDLLFYTDGGGDMYHVTVYAGNGLMIEAPYPGATVRAAPVRTTDLVAQVAHFG